MIIYLDNAATSFPKPSSVYNEMLRCMKTYAANEGRGAHTMSVIAAEKVFETREALATLFNIQNPERIAFTYNATMALNMGIKGILSAGDGIVISTMEHNSVYRPAMAADGVSVSFARADRNGVVTPEAVAEAIKPNTKLVCIIHASNVTGGVNDITGIGRLLRKRGILFMVDASQSAGCVDIDVQRDNIDILAFPGHKGLLGPQGTGALYVRDGIYIKTLMEGGTGSNSEKSTPPDFLPDRLESGTVNLPGIVGLGAGVKYVLNRGVNDIGEHERYFANILSEGLGNMKNITILGPSDRKMCTGVVSVSCKNHESGQLAYLLNRDYAIAVRAGLHCSPLAARTLGAENGSLRFSTGAFTTRRDVEAALFAMKKLTE